MTDPATQPTATPIPDHPGATTPTLAQSPAQSPAPTPPLLVLLAADDAAVCVDDVCATLPVGGGPADAASEAAR